MPPQPNLPIVFVDLHLFKQELYQLSQFSMQLQEKMKQYAGYLSMSEKQKKKRVDKAEQDKEHRHNPQKDHKFTQQNFVKFYVEDENGKEIQLVTYRQVPKEQARAVLMMFHGLNSHIGHGAHIAKYFAENGIITMGFDHRGFGRSPGTPGRVISHEQHVKDSIDFINLVKPLYPNLPFFCMGLSMGGMTTYYLTHRYPEYFQGAIMMAPALMNQVSDFVVGVASFLKKILPQNTRLVKPTYGMASKNPQITVDIKKDNLAFKDRTHLSTVHMLVDTMNKSPQTFKDYNFPFMIIQGGLDKLVNPDVAFQLFKQSQTPIQDKQILFYQNMWHDIWHQQQIYEIMQKIVVWISGRIEKKKLRQSKYLQAQNKGKQA